MAETVYVSGKCKWAKVHTPDLEYKCWSVLLYPDKDSYAKIMELQTASSGGIGGILNVMKKDEDGYNITFKRKTHIQTKRAGEVALQPPMVLDNEGKPTKEPIGNGSDVTLRLEVYQYTSPTKAKGRAARIEAVRIDNLVPYTKSDFDDGQTKQVGGLTEQPQQLF